jgi:hypothetical protein
MPQKLAEDHHHSPQQVNGYIEQAIVLLDAHTLTPDERAQLLPQIVNLLAAKQIIYGEFAPSGIALPQNARH